MLVAGSGGGSVTRTITTANSGSTSETAQFVTPAGTLQTTAAATTTITHNGQANVTEIAYNVTGSSDPAIAAGTGVAHIANFAPVVGLSYTDFGAWSVDTSTSTSNPPTYLGVFAGGKPGQNTTATSGMPTSGSATFSGGAAGYASQPRRFGRRGQKRHILRQCQPDRPISPAEPSSAPFPASMFTASAQRVPRPASARSTT